MEQKGAMYGTHVPISRRCCVFATKMMLRFFDVRWLSMLLRTESLRLATLCKKAELACSLLWVKVPQHDVAAFGWRDLAPSPASVRLAASRVIDESCCPPVW